MTDMAEKINIVPFSDEYAAAVEAIVIEAWTPIREEYKREIGNELYSMAFGDWKKKKVEQVLSNMRKGRGYVALVDGEVAGFIHYSVGGDKISAEVGNNAVSSRFRGRGIAQKMYSFVEEKMKNEGVKYVTVVTGLDNGHAPARRAYEKAGFDKGLESVRYFKMI